MAGQRFTPSHPGRPGVLCTQHARFAPYLPSSPGTYVTRAEATDTDDPDTDNAALYYSILEQGRPELFSIHERTGEIRTVHVGLDREVRRLWASGPDGKLDPYLGNWQLREFLSQNSVALCKGPGFIPSTPKSFFGLALGIQGIC